MFCSHETSVVAIVMDEVYERLIFHDSLLINEDLTFW